MKRDVITKVSGFNTLDDFGVPVCRMMGINTINDYNPFLLLDYFDHVENVSYAHEGGFPAQPSRGIEQITYILGGELDHRDHLGNVDVFGKGDVLWLSTGSGVLFADMISGNSQYEAVRIWLNVPKDEKMDDPSYVKINNLSIPEMYLDHGLLRVLTGSYKDLQSVNGSHLPLDMYDVRLQSGAVEVIETPVDRSVAIMVVSGAITINGATIGEKSVAKLSQGDTINIENRGKPCQFIVFSSLAVSDRVVWGGPIIMCTEKAVEKAYTELEKGDFLKVKPVL